MQKKLELSLGNQARETDRKYDFEKKRRAVVMSNRERCHMLLDELDDAMLEEIISYIRELQRADEAEDDKFCQSLHDLAIAEDDGYRVSADDLRLKYEE